MPLTNADIAQRFEQLADLLEIEGANTFRVRAYRNAARSIRSYPRSMASLVDEHARLSDLPAIGRDLAKKIETLVGTGRLPALEQIERRTPASLTELLAVEGLGPKRVRALHDALGIATVDDLARAIRGHRVRSVEGFSARTEAALASRLAARPAAPRRIKLAEAEQIAAPLVAYLSAVTGVEHVIVAGSFRRRRETVGDLDILVTARRGLRVTDRFVDWDDVTEVVSHGPTRASVRLESNIDVDLRVVPKVSFGAALCYFTGSKAHNIAIRKLGVGKHLKINEYGVFRRNKRIAGRTEAEVYRKVGLDWVPPELREDRGEIEAAGRHRLPSLVTLADIRGDLHCHTNASDGHDSLECMVDAARERGYEYVSINDHSQHLTIAHGLNKRRLQQQIRAIDRLNARLDDIVILKSAELDILEDGRLDLPNDVLKALDFTVCAIHHKFKLSAAAQTERIIRAMDNPYCNVLAHPTGRLINERDAYAIDLEAVLKAAAARSCVVELNAHPDRLDLDDAACRTAKSLGVKVALGSDAHRATDLDFMRFGIDQARRGWLEASDIVNTRSLDALTKLFKRA